MIRPSTIPGPPACSQRCNQYARRDTAPSSPARRPGGRPTARIARAAQRTPYGLLPCPAPGGHPRPASRAPPWRTSSRAAPALVRPHRHIRDGAGRAGQTASRGTATPRPVPRIAHLCARYSPNRRRPVALWIRPPHRAPPYRWGGSVCSRAGRSAAVATEDDHEHFKPIRARLWLKTAFPCMSCGPSGRRLHLMAHDLRSVTG